MFGKNREAFDLKPESNDLSFEKQMGQKIETNFGFVVDAKPLNPKSEVPVLVAPGWAGTPETYKATAREQFIAGRETLSINHSRIKPNLESSKEKTDLPIAQFKRVLNIIEAIEKTGHEKTDCIAHSQGGIDVVIAAKIRPDLFQGRNLVLMNSAGLVGELSFFELFNRFAIEQSIKTTLKTFTKPASMKYVALYMKEFTKYVASNPKLALEEVRAITKADIYKALAEIHEAGVKIAVVAGVDDPVFPMNEIQEKTKREKSVVDHDGEPIKYEPSPAIDGGFYHNGKLIIDGFYSVRGDHAELLFNPKQYGAAAEKVLSALEKKRV